MTELEVYTAVMKDDLLRFKGPMIDTYNTFIVVCAQEKECDNCPLFVDHTHYCDDPIIDSVQNKLPELEFQYKVGK